MKNKKKLKLEDFDCLTQIFIIVGYIGGLIGIGTFIGLMLSNTW